MSSSNLQAQSSAVSFHLPYNGTEADEQATAHMVESWKHWEGEIVDGQFPLRQYLGGADRGAVFLTEHGSRRENAAIRLVPAVSDSSGQQLAIWEQAGKLQHPHLLRIFHFGRCQLADQGLLYVVMEYADENLSQVLPQRPLSAAEVREMLRPLLEVLAFLHAQGFAHGHVTPANIMAAADQLKISSDSVCPAGTCARTSASEFLPPETGSGQTPAGDVWSLGVTLVEALTLRRPVWQAVSGGELVLPEELPQPFLDIVRRCLHLVPGERCTIAEIQAQLDPSTPALPAKPIAAAPVSEPSAPAAQRVLQIKTPARRPPYLIPLIIAAVALLAMAGWRIWHSPPAAPYPSAHQAEVPLSGSSASPAPQEQTKPAPDLPANAVSRQPFPAKPAPAIPRQVSASPKPSLPLSSEQASAAGTPLAGSVLHQVLPAVPRSARDTIEGHVRVSVKVAVDPSGNVARATLDSPGPSRYFASLALEAARDWKFTPAEVNGHKVASAWILHFAFGREGTEVRPESVAR